MNSKLKLKPFEENSIPSEKRFWKSETWDENLPSPGFLTDYILSTRGIETPTKFCLWSGIWAVSSVLKRDAYFEQFPRPLYPNFYIFLVAPPALCRKSTAGAFCADLLDTYHYHIEDPELSAVKRVRLYRGKSTPEKFIDSLKATIEAVDLGASIKEIDRGSQASLFTSELAVFLNKRKYNETLVDVLGDLYDCLDRDSVDTIGRGTVPLRNIYVTWLGAATPEHLENSIPVEAFGGGFASRLIVAYEITSPRMFPTPLEVLGGPTKQDLQERLAWIATKKNGVYRFNPQVEEYYNKKWYPGFRQGLCDESNDAKRNLLHRYDIHLKKLSIIIRAQRYEEGTTIIIRDFVEADRILRATFGVSDDAIKNIGASYDRKWMNRVMAILRKEKSRTRRQLQQAMSPYSCNADHLQVILKTLHGQGSISVRLDGQDREAPSRKGNEKYFWNGEENFESKDKN